MMKINSPLPTSEKTFNQKLIDVSMETDFDTTDLHLSAIKNDGLSSDSGSSRKLSNGINLTNTSLENYTSSIVKPVKLELDMSVYKDIILKRDAHAVFTFLTSITQQNEWFYKDDSGICIGPLDCLQMDQKYKDYTFKETSLIKSSEESTLLPLSRYVKRYYCQKLSSRQSKESNALMSLNRKFNVISENSNCDKAANKKEDEETNRVDTLPRVGLHFLNCTEDATDSDDEDDTITTRTRAYTRTCK